MGRIYRRPGVRRDLIAHYCYLAENAGEAVADEFLSRVEASFNDLIEQPKIGAPLTVRPTELAGLRKWPVKDFDNVLIFYLPHPMACPSCESCMLRGTGGACWGSSHSVNRTISSVIPI